MAVHKSDVLVAVGARFDDRVTGKVEAFAPDAEIVHIDIDPSSISKNIKVHVPIVGDCRRVLRALVEAVREESTNDVPALAHEARKQWLAQIAEWRGPPPPRVGLGGPRVERPTAVPQRSETPRGGGAIVP